jgi:hypothetical protein
MKKALVLIVMFLFVASPALADFKWGTDTYSSVGNQLIINSLGDQTTVSTFGKLGNNDWIPENAVKNYLLMEGYTSANDYNPSITNPQFASAYSEKPPEGYTKLQFAGKLGDPRALQDVYVDTKEYNRLNSEQQAQRMDGIDVVNSKQDTKIQNNTTAISTETTNRVNADNTLQQNINSTNSRVDDLDNRVDKLERTQTIVGAEVRVYDSRKVTVTMFADYSQTRQMVDRTGIRFTWKCGESYQDKEMKKLEKRIEMLEAK